MERGRMKINEMLAAQMTAHETMRDLHIPAPMLSWHGIAEGGADELLITAQGDSGGTELMTDHALSQVCGRFDMPIKYIRTLPSLLSAPLFNYGNSLKPDASYLLRYAPLTEHRVRAFLSNRYVPLDNTPVLSTLADIEKSSQTPMRVFETYNSPDEFYFKWLLGAPINLDGETFNLGVVIGNSEIGTRSASCEPFLYRDACENGLIFGYRSWSEAVYKRRHIYTSPDELYIGFVKALERTFGLLPAIDRMIKTAKERTVVNLDAYISGLVEEYGFAQYEAKGIVDRARLDAGTAKPSAWHVVNAITASAKEASVERQLDMERIGGEILADLLGDREVVAESITALSGN